MLLAIAACALLTSAEIARVQGEVPRQAKPSGSASPGFTVQRCFYALPTFSRSISLEVTRGRGVPGLWHDAFHNGRRGEDEGEATPPQRIRGLGEEAFWTGDPRLGGLYVLLGDAMLRLSIGGNDRVAGKVRRLKRLARAALKRL